MKTRNPGILEMDEDEMASVWAQAGLRTYTLCPLFFIFDIRLEWDKNAFTLERNHSTEVRATDIFGSDKLSL
jgi:hypothetical protein